MPDGLLVIDRALERLRERDPSIAARFGPRGSRNYYNAGGQIHWSLASQNHEVTNRDDDTDTPRVRIAAQLTIQRPDATAILEALKESRGSVEAGVGHRLSWLRGGDSGNEQRAMVRSWHELAGNEGALADWLSHELIGLRAALRPHVVNLGRRVL